MKAPNEVIDRSSTTIPTDDLRLRDTISAATINAWLTAIRTGSDRAHVTADDIQPLCQMLDAALSLGPPKRPTISLERVRQMEAMRNNVAPGGAA